jgi:hypothetical protein
MKTRRKGKGEMEESKNLRGKNYKIHSKALAVEERKNWRVLRGGQKKKEPTFGLFFFSIRFFFFFLSFFFFFRKIFFCLLFSSLGWGANEHRKRTCAKPRLG